MSKVFRLYNIQGNPNIVDWQDTNVYGTQAISEITDPDGADAKKEITSIPSPFARIDLIKTAFREVVNMANRDAKAKGYASFEGKTIYHKMVSDALDIAQIFFNIDTFKDKFEILVWDRSKDLKVNNVLGKTLKRYLESDATGEDPYNFSKLERIYMLNYIGPDRPGNLNIVGATSPTTLFFSSANDLDYVSKNINFGQDRPFDHEYQPLYKRDFEFQKYIYAFREAYGIKAFGKHFREIEDYLINSTGKECNYKHLNEEQKRIIDALDESSIAGYEPIAIGEKGADQLEILSKPFCKKPKVINWKSDFEIDSTIFQGEKKPLVLPVEAGNTYEKLKYTTNIWGKQHKAPYSNNTLWVNRRLPIVDDEYPYLTISDFLTDTIIRMPYEINKDSFFDGNIDRADGKSYLLPLTELFFKFFTTEQLRGTLKDGKKMFELKNNAGGITTVLRIPIKGNKHIEYRRTYFEAVEPDIENNDGGLVEKKFGLGIFPLVSVSDNVRKHYRIALFDKGIDDVKLECFDGSKKTLTTTHVIRCDKNLELNICSLESYVINNSFDNIEVAVGNQHSGIIIPKFRKIEGKKEFVFAIDFGTTNTHIEYSIDGSDPIAFDIRIEEKQLHLMHLSYGKDLDIKTGFLFNFLPDIIGEQDIYSFPMRTVFAESLKIDYEKNPYALADGNIPFYFEKGIINNEVGEAKTDLKWGGIPDKLIKLYLENIFLLLRNKVILNGGNLDATRIIWFYPASMTEGRCDEFNKIWKKLYLEFFGKNVDEAIISMSESCAPYQYYNKKKGAKSEVVTIDVGGGTTDVYIVEERLPKMLLSFRFASNAIFGDGYNWDIDENGFLNLYFEKYQNILEKNNYDELVQVLKQIRRNKSKNKSADITTFFFGLAENKEIGHNESLDFLHDLSINSRLRYVFIIFYGAILYFIAQSMKAKKLQKPLTIAFSGNGAKTLKILSDKNEMIARFAKLIFDGVYGQVDNNKLNIIFEEQPKKATCKGGILNPVNQNFDKIDNLKTVLIGDDFDTIRTQKLRYADITRDIEQDVVHSVSVFMNFMFDLHENNNDFFINKLNADAGIFDKVKDICTDKTELKQSLSLGLNKKYEELFGKSLDSIDDEKGLAKIKKTQVEEPLFFYPLVNVLHEIAREISEL